MLNESQRHCYVKYFQSKDNQLLPRVQMSGTKIVLQLNLRITVEKKTSAIKQRQEISLPQFCVADN